MSRPCDCSLCQKEDAWEEEYGLCYRCSHGAAPYCQAAQDRGGEPCCTILDVILRAADSK